MKNCPKCKSREPSCHKFCTGCGEDLRKVEDDKCKCGNLKSGSDKFCSECGEKY